MRSRDYPVARSNRRKRPTRPFLFFVLSAEVDLPANDERAGAFPNANPDSASPQLVFVCVCAVADLPRLATRCLPPAIAGAARRPSRSAARRRTRTVASPTFDRVVAAQETPPAKLCRLQTNPKVALSWCCPVNARVQILIACCSPSSLCAACNIVVSTLETSASTVNARL